MALNRITFMLLIAASLLTACSSIQHISKTAITYDSVSASSAAPDSKIDSIIAPYKGQIDESMSEVVGTVSKEMTKKKPESTLGNWYCDAMLSGAEYAGFEVDFAISNYGGLRVPYLSQGPLTRGEIFELSPFDNWLVIVDIPGTALDSVLQFIAESEGWPVSKGLNMVIKDKRLVSIRIKGQPLDPRKTYHVAMPDYIANGGDGFKILIPLPRQSTGLLQRDIVIAYAQALTREGKEISADVEGRITIEK
jgi:2',3'-cyclic-nucleotide 2'-phosphodiesterase (5'-nucleotidase family)